MTDPRTLQLKLRRMHYGAKALATQALAKPTRFVFKEQHETADAATARFARSIQTPANVSWS